MDQKKGYILQVIVIYVWSHYIARSSRRIGAGPWKKERFLNLNQSRSVHLANMLSKITDSIRNCGNCHLTTIRDTRKLLTTHIVMGFHAILWWELLDHPSFLISLMLCVHKRIVFLTVFDSHNWNTMKTSLFLYYDAPLPLDFCYL